MGAQDDNGVATPPEDGVAIAAPEPKKSKRSVGPRKRLIILAVVCLIVLAGIAYGTYKLVHKSTSQVATKNATTAKSKLTPTQQSEQLDSQGKYGEAKALLVNQLNAASNKNDKITLVLQLEALAFNNKKYDDAMTYAKQFDTIQNHTAGSSEMLAQVYAAEGDKTTAKAYMNKAISLLDPKSDDYNRTLAQYQHELEELGQ